MRFLPRQPHQSWIVLAGLALAPAMAWTQDTPSAAQQIRQAREGADPALGAPGWAMPPEPAAPARKVRQLGDGELSCAQLYAETQALDAASQAQEAESAKAQKAMADSQEQMMKQATEMRGMGMGSSIGSSLLGMIPGASQVQGMALQAAAQARASNMQEQVNQMMQAQNQLMQVEQSLEYARARSEHLTDLFLKKGCKLSELKGAAGAAP